MKRFLFISLLVVVPHVFAGSPPQLEPLVGVCNYGDDNFADVSSALQSPNVRLPNNVVPFHYDLELRPILTEGDPDQFKAPGEVEIHLICVTESNSITLHSSEIEIKENEVQVRTADGTPIEVADQTYDPAVSTYTIILQSRLTPNETYTLTIPFTSLVAGNRLEGLYRSSYEDADGNVKWLATTQFQKLGARLAFPCFDEPALRATFNIKIGRTAAFHSLSNAPVLEEGVPIEGLDGWFWDEYNTTVSMSTYLVAFIVSDFTPVQAPSTLSNYTVKTWGPPPMTTPDTGKFSAEAAAKILNFLEQYYDSKYQFPKLDSVAIPDFEAGAMENWALNTYRIVLMLWFDGESTQFEQWRQSAVIAHEIVHHWFGDLVTCSWWNDLWLNEGFARYMQFIGSTATGSDFGQIDRYTIDVIQLAMDFDVTANSVPVHSDVTDQVVNQPSRIIYEKAAALIRMMQGFLSEDTLIKGLKNYLKEYEYSNTVQDQLFASLQAQADEDQTLTEFTVKEIMDSWTLQTGFPLIRVSNAGFNRILLSQERFELAPQRQTVKQSNGGLWFVPVSIATKHNPDFSESNRKPALWLDNLTLVQSYSLGESDALEWVIVNPDARYYYRVLYDDHFFKLIKEQLETDHEVFSLSTRSQMIDDYFKSATAKYINIKSALDLTVYLTKENENTVWTSVFNNIRPIYRYLQDQTATVQLMKDYFLKRIEPALDRIGWEAGTSDTPVTWFLRAQLMDWACVFGSANCTTVTTSKIQAWDADPIASPIRADLQPMIFCKGISIVDSLTGVNLRSRLMDEYDKAYRTERFTLIINSLACESNANELERLMNMTIDAASSIDKKLHGTSLLQRIAENPQNRQTVIDWLEASKAAVTAELGQTAFSSVISTIASYTTSTSMATAVSTTIDKWINEGTVNETSVVNSLRNSKSVLDTNAKWIDDYATDINSWLTEALAY